jgi:hypothetical protein
MTDITEKVDKEFLITLGNTYDGMLILKHTFNNIKKKDRKKGWK